MTDGKVEDDAQTPEEARIEAGGLPPFISSWKVFYAVVLITLIALILLFYGIQVYFA